MTTRTSVVAGDSAGGGLALALEATLDEVVATIHGHPTLGEAVREAALEVRGEALHLPH